MNNKEIIKAIEEGLSHTIGKEKTIVVGAGIAGLTAAQILQKSGFEVLVLEASNLIGGRIRVLQGFAELPVELGAEEIHGRKTAWYELIKKTGKKIFEWDDEFDEYYFLDNQLKSESDISEDEDFEQANTFFEEIEDYEGEDISVKELIAKIGINPRVHHLIDAWIGSEYGTDVGKLSVKSLAESSEKWSAGSKSYILAEDSFDSVIKEVFAEIADKIRYNSAVNKINYSGERVEITCQNGEKFTADKVIVTVALSILKNNFIQFIPDLPAEKTAAIKKIGIDAGMKIILQFKERFWEEYAGSFCGDGLVPEFYTFPKSEEPIVIAYIMGDKARQLSNLGDKASEVAVRDLDRMFGEEKASKNLLNVYIADWLKEPFIQGAYSYPSPDSEAARIVLAKAIENKVFFAGEATNCNGHFASVHGALETGYLAALEICKFTKIES